MPIVRAGALDLAYHELGRGEPVLLINGTGESGETWLPFVEPLAGRFRLVAIDQRDTGASGYVDGPYAPRDLAADAIAVVEQLGLGPVHVAGYSLGGAVAQEMALARPDLVRSLVLLSTWAASDGWFVAQMRNWQAVRRAHWDDEAGFVRALEPWLFAPSTFERPEDYRRIHAMWAAETPQRPDGFLRQCDADVAHDAGARLRDVRAPALVLVGAEDVCTPPRYARALAGLIPDARLVTVSDAGHCALFEQPDAVRGAVAAFLDERRGRAFPPER